MFVTTMYCDHARVRRGWRAAIRTYTGCFLLSRGPCGDCDGGGCLTLEVGVEHIWDVDLNDFHVKNTFSMQLFALHVSSGKQLRIHAMLGSSKHT